MPLVSKHYTTNFSNNIKHIRERMCKAYQDDKARENISNQKLNKVDEQEELQGSTCEFSSPSNDVIEKLLSDYRKQFDEKPVSSRHPFLVCSRMKHLPPAKLKPDVIKDCPLTGSSLDVLPPAFNYGTQDSSKETSLNKQAH